MTTNACSTIAPSPEGGNLTTSEPTPTAPQTSPRPWFTVSTHLIQRDVERWVAVADAYRDARRGAFDLVRAGLVAILQGDDVLDLVGRASSLGPEGLDDLRAHVERARRLVEALPIDAVLAELTRGGRRTAAEIAMHVDNALDEMARHRALEVGLVAIDDEVDVVVADWPGDERRRRARDFFLARLGEVEVQMAKRLAEERAARQHR